MSSGVLLYLYGVVAADAPQPPPTLRGLEDGSIRLVGVDGLAAIVSEVSAETYSEAQLEERLADVQWVGERAVAHERVLTWFVDRGALVPFSVFSLHVSEDALGARLRERYAILEERLGALRGHREWSIRLWRDEERFAARLSSVSAPLRDLEAEMADAGEGRRFLLSRKRDALHTEEARRHTAELLRMVFTTLSEQATDSRVLPIAVPPATARASRTLVMHAAFLVNDDAYAAFETRVQEMAASDAAQGFDWEFTGPWPAYHFAAAGQT